MDKDDALLGKTFTVKIVKVDKFYMVGEVIDHPGQKSHTASKVSCPFILLRCADLNSPSLPLTRTLGSTLEGPDA